MILPYSIVILEKIIVIEIQWVEHQIPVFAPNEVAIFYFVVKEPDWIVILVILGMGTLDKKRLKINNIALSISKSDAQLVIATRFNSNNIVWVHFFISFY